MTRADIVAIAIAVSVFALLIVIGLVTGFIHGGPSYPSCGCSIGSKLSSSGV